MRQVVRCFLKNKEGKYLLVKHLKSDFWTLPGGHIEENENLYEALTREIKEEFNLNIKINGEKDSFNRKELYSYPIPLSIYSISYNSKKHGEIKKLEYIFLAEITSGNLKIQEEEIKDYNFFTLSGILNLENTFKQIKEISKKLG